MPRVLIVGGGITGLTIAYRLQRLMPLAEIHVWEASGRLGGAIWTETDNGFVIEHGPNGFLDNKRSLLDLAHELGLGNRLLVASEAARKNRYLFLNNRLQQLPNSVLSILKSPLLSWPGKIRMLAEPLVHRRKSRPESVAAFSKRRFGQEAADVFIDALVTGIHGGDPALLDVRAAFPRMTNWEQQFGSVVRGVLYSQRQRRSVARAWGIAATPQRMWSFPNGLREVIDALSNQLRITPQCDRAAAHIERPDGSWIVQDCRRESLRADCVVLACPAYQQAKLLRPIDTTLAQLAEDIPYNRIAVVAMAFREPDVAIRPDGFGFIAPQRTRKDILGVQWCSSIYSGRAPNGLVLWRALCGGWNRPEIVDWPDDRIAEAVRQQLRIAHGIVAPPILSRIIRWPQAIPQYVVGHPARVCRIEQRAAELPGIFLAGNAYRGIALNDCVEDAGRVAQSAGRYVETLGRKN